MLPGTLPASGSSLGSPSAKPIPPFQCPRLESHLLIPSSGAQDLGPPLQLCSFSNRGFYPYWCHGTPLASSEGYVPTSEYFQIKHTEENAKNYKGSQLYRNMFIKILYNSDVYASLHIK